MIKIRKLILIEYYLIGRTQMPPIIPLMSFIAKNINNIFSWAGFNLGHMLLLVVFKNFFFLLFFFFFFFSGGQFLSLLISWPVTLQNIPQFGLQEKIVENIERDHSNLSGYLQGEPGVAWHTYHPDYHVALSLIFKLFHSSVCHRKLKAMQMILVHRNCKLCLVEYIWLLLLAINQFFYL